MLGFILSKINLLILAVAIFAIVAYFMFSLADIMEVHESQLLLTRLRDKADSLVTSQTYCDAVFNFFPDSIRVTGKDLYYAVKVSVEQGELDSKPVNYLIFSLFQRNDLAAGASGRELFTDVSANALAAESVRTFSDIRLYNLPATGQMEAAEGFTVIDPQGFPTTSAVVLLKQVNEGKATLYVIPCGTTDNCIANASQVSCLVAGKGIGCDPDLEGAFRCAPQ